MDFSRILQYIKSLDDFDVICLQELARNMTEYCAPDQTDHLQMAQQFFKDYEAVWGTGFSWPAENDDGVLRQEFGNLSLVKPRLLDRRIHQLPQPATPGKNQMPRVAVETVVDSRIGALSIINTHLAFHDDNENQQQVEHLHHLEQERAAHHREPKLIGTGTYQQGFLASARLLCGDFNFTPDTAQYRYQINTNWIDAWVMCNGDEAHPPTCGVFDTLQWPQGKQCCDFFWLSHELQSLDAEISVLSETSLSDHQPVIFEISI